MPDLSPAAQAVLNAWTASENGVYLEDDPERLAAALRAAVEQVISPVPPPCDDFDDYAKGLLASHLKYRHQLLAIATELEGHQ